MGPIWSPLLTTAVLRYGSREFNFNRMQIAWRQKAKYAPGTWNFTCTDRGARMHVRIGARAQDTVALRYRNPSGGIKTCLNSKLGFCELTLEQPGKPLVQLSSATGAAFEILTDVPPSGSSYAN